MSKENTIEGTAFRCQENGCNKMFIAGSAGIKPLAARVIEHHKKTRGHTHIPPINPKVGMVYEGTDGNRIGKPYAGQDVQEWLNSVIMAGRKAGRAIRPVWDLVEAD